MSQAFYWGTSEWSAYEIEHAHRKNAKKLCDILFDIDFGYPADVATRLGLIGPIVDQTRHKYICTSISSLSTLC